MNGMAGSTSFPGRLTNATWPHGGSPGSKVTRNSMEVTVRRATPGDIRQ